VNKLDGNFWTAAPITFESKAVSARSNEKMLGLSLVDCSDFDVIRQDLE